MSNEQQILKQLEHMRKLTNDAYLLVAGMRGQLEGMITDLRGQLCGQQSLFDESEGNEGGVSELIEVVKGEE